MQFNLGWVAHPIFSEEGGYPSIMINEILKNSLKENRTKSRLPIMSAHKKKLIKGSADFLGLNYYTSRYVENAEETDEKTPSYANDVRIKETVDKSWIRAKSNWLYSVPEGLGALLR